MPLADVEFWGNPLRSWLAALAVTVGSAIALGLLTRLARRRQRTLDQTQPGSLASRITGLIGQTRGFFVLLLAVQLASLTLALPPAARQLVRTATVIGALLQFGFWGNALIRLFIQAREQEDPSRKTTFNALELISRVAMWGLVVLLALDNVPGVEINTLIASLGIGGVAAALAVQNVLSDLFASLSIALDRPFKIGDFIVVDGFEGTVEDIGLRSTRLRSLPGEQLIFSNSDLLKSRIRNYQSMPERRVVFRFGVTYDTPSEALAAIPGVVQEIVEAQERARFGRAHFKEFGDFALVFEVVYFVLSGDYLTYMNCQQAVNLALRDRLARLQISFAFPTRTVILQSTEPAPPGWVAGQREGSAH